MVTNVARESQIREHILPLDRGSVGCNFTKFIYEKYMNHWSVVECNNIVEMKTKDRAGRWASARGKDERRREIRDAKRASNARRKKEDSAEWGDEAEDRKSENWITVWPRFGLLVTDWTIDSALKHSLHFISFDLFSSVSSSFSSFLYSASIIVILLLVRGIYKVRVSSHSN